MRSLDSPVIKRALLNTSTARLVGAPASPSPAANEEAPQSRVPDWVAALATATDSSASPAAPATKSDAVLGATLPEPAEPERSSHPVPEEAGGEEPERRVLVSARERLSAIETEIARAEARLSETQARLEDLEREANLARQMAREARDQADAMRAEARREGRQEGIVEAEREMAEQLAAVAALAEGAVRARDEYLHASEPEIIALVIEIARKVIGQELAMNKDAVAQVARRALEAAGQSEAYFLHLHPDDAAIVERQLQRDALGMTLQVVPDERMAPGNCLVRTAHGRVDACVETQLNEIHQRMLGVA